MTYSGCQISVESRLFGAIFVALFGMGNFGAMPLLNGASLLEGTSSPKASFVFAVAAFGVFAACTLSSLTVLPALVATLRGTYPLGYFVGIAGLTYVELAGGSTRTTHKMRANRGSRAATPPVPFGPEARNPGVLPSYSSSRLPIRANKSSNRSSARSRSNSPPSESFTLSTFRLATTPVRGSTSTETSGAALPLSRV
jgi:hypothetical protein